MSEFSNSFFRDLPPRERRYDVPVGDQLVFCVFPNGVKTWVHVYPFEEFTRRRTIGLYPDMRYEQVHEALDASRRIVDLDTDYEKRRIKEVHRNRGLRNFGMTVLATATGVAVSVLVAKNLQGGVAPAPEIPVATIDSPGTNSPDLRPGPETPEAYEEFINTAGPPSSESKAIVSGPAIEPRAPLTDGDQHASPVESDLAAPKPEEIEAAPATTPNVTLAQAGSTEPANDGAPVETIEPEDGNPDSNVVQDEPHVQEDPVDAEPAPEPVESIDTGAVTTNEPEPSDKVRRALLADGVEKHEPTGVLENRIGIGPGAVRSLFFFTELRGLGGERIRHRWNYAGKSLAEVPFDVGADGRWRVYSSKQISADQTGNWSVEVVTADDSVLSTVSFEVEQTVVE
ncbi:MAG: DUF2914 domain-containing protein [Gammaproteobacteria bacterium]